MTRGGIWRLILIGLVAFWALLGWGLAAFYNAMWLTQ